MKKYEKFLLMVFLVIALSITSAVISFFHKVSYGWDVDIPEDEVLGVTITQHGFPYGWYTVISYDSHIETTVFHSEPFIVDIIIYIIIYTLITGVIAVTLTMFSHSFYAFISQPSLWNCTPFSLGSG